jgi:iron complex outermembrane receptor protein
LAARWSDYDTFGSTTNGKIGIEWQPIDDLLLRATYSEGFRAPNISELFLGQQQSAESYTDPCRNYGVPGSLADPITVANCQADGLPIDFNLATFQATTRISSLRPLNRLRSESFSRRAFSRT